MPGLSATYNVIVIGDGLAGLMYAALAARAGYRVGVVSEGGRANAYRHRGHVFLREAERFYGFGTSPAIQRVFSELSVGMGAGGRPRPMDPIVQVVLPDRRLDVPRSADRWERELERELSDGGETMRAWESWAARWTAETHGLVGGDPILPPSGLWASSTYRRQVAAALPLLHGLPPDGLSPLGHARDGGHTRAVVEGTLAHLVDLRTHPLPALSAARLWIHLRAGLFRIRGGLDGMKDVLINKLKEQCGDCRRDARAERVVVKRGRAMEVVLAGRGERLGCDLLVCDADPRRFLHLIEPDARHDGFHNELATIEPSAWRLAVNVAVDPRVIPAGMGAEVVMLPGLRGGAGEPSSLWISRPGVAPFEQGEARPGPGVLHVTTLIPARGIAPGPPILERAVARVMDGLRDLIPWLDDHLLAVDVPAASETVDVSGLHAIYGSPVPMTLDVGALPMRTPYRNVLLLSQAVFGGLGLEGAARGALQALATTRELVRLKVLRTGLS